ncbi:MAG: hypothetical protein JRI57_00030 [Deltaproteobacteria bacterium]|nr:hypothetical protein [Deltaproteobacteria bacterium]MBW1951458.1 hypothetical protein [Deltaproteobacteria bacterium]MBW1986887.1 hypothetical protein [Deltaproteobacteria bacterium]MBW2134997.1 hypothetical protein [Deltaproteobacteria bacterium]
MITDLIREIGAIVSGRLCTEAQRQKCQQEDQGFSEWACSQCREYIPVERISPWTWHLLFLYQLQSAGYPFQANDLSLETWMLLGLFRRIINSQRLVKNSPSSDRHTTA